MFSFNSTAASGTLMIDSSTIDPVVSKEMARKSEEIGAVYMDAPVSGGIPYMIYGCYDYFSDCHDYPYGYHDYVLY